MTHPRLSVSEMCTYPLPFSEELQLWDELELQHVGLLANKVDDYGRAKAVAALRERGITAVTVTTGHFDLSDPSSWDVTRAAFSSVVDLAAEVGGCVYCTPGRRDGHRSFDDLAAAFAAAIEPVAEYAAKQGVTLAVEPSLRTDVSFAHTLRDGIDLVQRAGISVIADLGNCWMERDVEATVRRAGPVLAAVQFADALYGSTAPPAAGKTLAAPPGGRAVPGDGDLAIDAFLRAALDVGYTGAFELEMVGPRIEAEGYAEALRRGVKRSSVMIEELLS
jgi:sugar phosphate isomerase/epimerase